jgi:hypothetical protein
MAISQTTKNKLKNLFVIFIFKLGMTYDPAEPKIDNFFVNN